MRSVRGWCALGLICGSTFAGSAPCLADPTVAVLARVRASMVIVSSHISAHRDSIGAGVVVAVEPGRMRVVTARHVADYGAVTIWIDGRPQAAEIVRTFTGRDLAVVETVGPHLDRLPVRAAVAAESGLPGSDIYVGGESAAGLQIKPASLVDPTFAAPDRAAGAVQLWISCDACAHGDSGAGIFDAHGRLVGILTARYSTLGDRTLAIVGEPLQPASYAITDGPVELATSP